MPRTSALEIYYLAVDRDAWGTEVGSRLLRAIDDHARSTGHRRLELWVVADNARAIATFEREGCARTDVTQLTGEGRAKIRLVPIVARTYGGGSATVWALRRLRFHLPRGV